MALPQVTEKPRPPGFKVPLWWLRGRALLVMGRDETTAVGCATEPPSHRATEPPSHRATEASVKSDIVCGADAAR